MIYWFQPCTYAWYLTKSLIVGQQFPRYRKAWNYLRSKTTETFASWMHLSTLLRSCHLVGEWSCQRICEKNVQEVRRLWSLSAERNRFAAARVHDCYCAQSCRPILQDFDLRTLWSIRTVNNCQHIWNVLIFKFYGVLPIHRTQWTKFLFILC